jgi:Protein of unknown function (DUF3108)
VSALLRWIWPLAFAASLVAMPRLHAAPEAAATKVALRWEVYAFAGFHVLTNRTTVVTAPGRYRITTDLDTRGIASLFIDLNSRSEVRGQLVGDEPSPELYHSDVMRNGVDRRYRIDYAAAGPLASEWTSPMIAWQTPVAAARLRGTVDQLTAYFMVENQLNERGTCALVVPVFDGHGRYDLRFRDAGTETLPDLPGPTHVCEVVRDDIAGFPGNNDPAEGTYKRGRLWYARVGPGGRMIPARVDYDTEFGVVTSYLAELSGPDGDRRFLE